MILDFYIKEDYLKEIFKICDSIKSDKYYVRMAVSWCISLCLIKFYDETIDYLNNCKLDDFTYQKSIQKAIESYRITTNQKDYLRKMKKRQVKDKFFEVDKFLNTIIIFPLIGKNVYRYLKKLKFYKNTKKHL